MPNWVKNKVRAVNPADTEKLVAMLTKQVDGETVTNFDGIVPMPAEIRATMGDPIGPRGVFPAWYEWANYNWGTKWDNLEATVDGGVIEFFSAWTIPDYVYRKIGETIPIIVAYADGDDIGYGCGFVLYNEDGYRTSHFGFYPTQVANAILGYEFPGEYDDGGNPDYSSSLDAIVEELFTSPTPQAVFEKHASVKK